MTMVIKQYSHENLNDLTQLMNQWSEEVQYKEKEMQDSIEEVSKKSENKIFVAVNEEGKAIGYCLAGVCYYLGFKPFVEIIQLLVDENSRGQGIGAKLIEHISLYYKKLGINKVSLSSRIEREQAHEFYRKLGFRQFKQSIFFEKDI